MHKRAAVIPKASLTQYRISKVFITFSRLNLCLESRFKVASLKGA